jgi:hypothetical protein
MPKGAIHPNVDNWRRVSKLNVVGRMRKLVDQQMYKRPTWLTACERVPPLELQNLHMNTRSVRNPYPKMLDHLLAKYPDLRFQDCFVDGNDWSQGNDRYRDDHPAMQFVARQLDLMNTQGLSKRQAFAKTEEWFLERRQHLEREQKIIMALARDQKVEPMFTTAHAYWHAEVASTEKAHLQRILQGLRQVHDPESALRARERSQKAMEERDKDEKQRKQLVRALPRAEREVPADELKEDDIGEEAAYDPFAGADADELAATTPSLRQPVRVTPSIAADIFDTTGDLAEDRGELPSGAPRPERTLTSASEPGEPGSSAGVSMQSIRARAAQDVVASGATFGRDRSEGDETDLERIRRERRKRQRKKEENPDES